MSKHQIAVDMIDSRFEKMNAGGDSAALHAETEMAYEMAHALGVLDLADYTHYKVRHQKIIDQQHQAWMRARGLAV